MENYLISLISWEKINHLLVHEMLNADFPSPGLSVPGFGELWLPKAKLSSAFSRGLRVGTQPGPAETRT